jgi:2-octaprenyl-6-methoxyphenol hydroxylase
MDATVIIAGAGPAGLAAAALLGREGLKTIVVARAASDDPRTVALMQPSIQLLKYLEVWPGELAALTSPLKKLRIIDDTGALLSHADLEFDCKDLKLEAFGWNVPLNLLLPALRASAISHGVTFHDATVVAAVSTVDHISVTLSTGETLRAQVAIAADGANSALRTAAHISIENWSYEQTAIATSFAHTMGHNDISTEYHKHAGPFTTVPMPDGRSSLVWMERPARADEIMAMSDRELAAEIQIGTHGHLGLISAIGPRKAFPMKGLTARQFAKSRTILVGEAAHVVPPIGAQGLNMSLRDASTACDLILGQADAGSDKIMTEYNTKRRAEVLPRQQVINFMNRSLLEGFLPMEAARALGLTALSLLPPLKRAVMQHGLAPSKNTPFAMREAS